MEKPFDFTNLPTYFSSADLNIAEFAALCDRQTDPSLYPQAERIEQNIPIYTGETVRNALGHPDTLAGLKAEWADCLKDGPGVFAVSGAYEDLSVIDRSTAVFEQIIAAEKEAGGGQGDHFGQNERIWNSIQKACLADPDLWLDYYGNPTLALACEAWLGPAYQITAQVNNVKPGSKSQSVHRDYHLGFQSRRVVASYPAHVQVMSQYLTLQGAIAHTEMTLETGPTRLLPFSQHYAAGYMAYTEQPFIDYFEQHHVQIPLGKGDAVFFSPALFHGAGTNQSEEDRLANLVQISSAFGRPMETVDRAAMVLAAYPALLERVKAGSISERMRCDVIAALGDGYAFPTNLDSDPPIGGNAPENMQHLLSKALDERWSVEQVREGLAAHAKRRQA